MVPNQPKSGTPRIQVDIGVSGVYLDFLFFPRNGGNASPSSSSITMTTWNMGDIK